uniref:C2H2-type domain-containing protein n=1 Tax=Nothobranchius furzeri TaxID=105023 RepID=A0A8C6PSI6_NOTFU
MWHIVQMGSVQDYGMVEEFISTVTEIVPELLNADQKAQLLLGLRARVVLEMCRSEEGEVFPGGNLISCIYRFIKHWAFTGSLPALNSKLLLFFLQDVFPTDFGPDYDHALQMLMLDFLSRLEKLLPVPDIQMLRASPSKHGGEVDTCLSPHLYLFIKISLHLPKNKNEIFIFTADETQTIPSSFGNCIMSSLSLPQLEKIVIHPNQLHIAPSAEQIPGCMTVQVEGETVTLLDYIQIEQPTGLMEADDHEETDLKVEEREEGELLEDLGEALKPAAFQPLRKKYSNNKTCPVCNKTFLRAAAMRRHQETHNENRDFKYKCSSCDKRFRDHYDLNRHEMRDPNAFEVLETKTCLLCGKYFARQVDMERHMKSHSEDRPYKCSYCEKKFKNPYVLKRHEREICKSREQKKPKRKETSLASMEPYSEISVEGKICPICSRILPCTADIAKHLRSHSEERPFICVTCEKGFKYKDTLKKHQIIHGHEGTKKPHKVCPVCSRAFDSIKTLNRHLQCHTEDRPYHCIHCKKRFKHMHGLKRHQIYRIHKGEFPYVCNKCPEKFRSSNCLTVHQRKHTGEKPFLCWQCGKCYRSASELTVHMGTHSEERPWACTQCDMAYRTKLQLNNHVEQIHIGVRYPCNTCGKQFMKETSLKRHDHDVKVQSAFAEEVGIEFQ